MTTQKFDATPTATEGINLDDIFCGYLKSLAVESAIEAKAEYKKSDKHDF